MGTVLVDLLFDLKKLVGEGWRLRKAGAVRGVKRVHHNWGVGSSGNKVGKRAVNGGGADEGDVSGVCKPAGESALLLAEGLIELKMLGVRRRCMG